MPSTTDNHGYIAIATAIVIAAIITTVTFVLAGSALLGRYTALIISDKKTSRFLAESCLEVARLKLVQNSGYTGNENIVLGWGSCTIETIMTDGSNRIITSSATFNQGTTELKLTVKKENLEKTSLREL